MLRDTLLIAGKDLRIELRARHGVSVVGPFVVTLLVAAGLGFGPGRALLMSTVPGLLWLCALFATVLACRRAYETELADDALRALALAPVSGAAVFCGKAAALAAQIFVLEAGAVAVTAVLFGVPVGAAPLVLLAAGVLGAAGLGALGALFGALSGPERSRESVLPLLVLPVAAPLLVDGVRVTGLALDGRPGTGPWLAALAAFGLVFWSAGALLYDHVLED